MSSPKPASEERSRSQPALAYDPYNQHQAYLASESRSPSTGYAQLHNYSTAIPQDALHQVAYDSMSTILEVDSEGSTEATLTGDDERSLARSPRRSLTVRTQRSHSTSPEKHPDSSPVSGLSLGDGLLADKFSGTLSALAEQVERLRRGSSNQSSPVASSSSPVMRATSKELAIGQQDESTSTPDLSSSLHEDEDGDDERDFELEHRTENKPTTGSRAPEIPKSRLGSAESLMMIAVSPISSPRARWPQVQDKSAINEEERRLVEVSNKSTITAIDLALMDRMVRKFFVDTREIATQSIEFDCDSDEPTSGTSRQVGARGRLRSAAAKPISTRNVAVGTEKFSRERFSLLPPTKTRSTQTKPNMDNDIGTSETRRYKLTHLDLGPIIRGRSADVLSAVPVSPDSVTPLAPASVTDTSSSALEGLAKNTLETRPVEDKVPMQRLAVEEPVKVKLAEQIQTSPLAGRPKLASKGVREDSLADDSPSGEEQLKETGRNQTSLARSAAVGNTSGPAEKTKETPASQMSKDVTVLDADREQSDKGRQCSTSRSVSLVPSVKTELRVIIEINDSKQRQRSEFTSDSTYLDGKLCRKSEVNTRKQVVETPRQVLQRLQNVAREHSLLAGQRASQQQSSPAAVRSALSRASSLSMSSLSGSPGNMGREWREVSKSSVRNEIETDTRNKHCSGASLGADELSMSSKALISHLADDKSAIALKSRATRRWQPEVGKAPIERTLVESEAAFDERQAGDLGDAVNYAQPAEPALARGVSSPALDRSDAPSETRWPQTPIVATRQAPSPVQKQRLKQSMSSQSLSSLIDQPAASANRRALGDADQASRRNHTQVSPDKRASQPSPQPNVRHARLEIEEESEDRRQVTRNGQLVYDDRLRERRYERTSSSPSLPISQSRLGQGQAKFNQASSGILRNLSRKAQPERSVLKPISNRPSPSPLADASPPPPLLFTDQNSTLSSEPETMDSGFAQSGVGSSSALNNNTGLTRQRPASQTLQLQRGAARSAKTSSPSPVMADLEPTSIEFVDEGVDELIEQLDQSRQVQSSTNKTNSHSPVDRKG